MTCGNQFTAVAEVYDDLMTVVPYRTWVDYVEGLWMTFGFRPHRVLDLACGTGAVMRHLIARGYEAEGVDLSASMLAIAGRSLPPGTRLWQQDMGELALPARSFDGCVCLFDSLNYLVREGQLESAFVGVMRALRPASPFIFDMNTILALERGMFTQSGTVRPRSLHYDWRSTWEPASRLCTVQMEFQVSSRSEEHVFSETHVQRGYDEAEIRRALVSAGFQVMGVFDSFTQNPPNRETDRWHWLSRSPD